MKEFLNKPITWKDSLKVTGVIMAINVIIYGAYYTWYYFDEIKGWVVDKVGSVKNWLHNKANKLRRKEA